MNNALRNKLYAYHRSQENAISGPDLVEDLGLSSTRELRGRVHALREEGCPICATSDRGYWWATSPADAEHCIASLRRHALECLTDAQLIELAVSLQDAEQMTLGV